MPQFFPHEMRDSFHIISAVAIWLTALFILGMLAFFLSRLLKHRHELKIARIESGKLDPLKTEIAAFLFFRRGIILIFIGLNFGLCYILGHPGPIGLLPLFLGFAYITIYFIHAKGIVKLFPENGSGAKSEKPPIRKARSE